MANQQLADDTAGWSRDEPDTGHGCDAGTSQMPAVAVVLHEHDADTAWLEAALRRNRTAVKWVRPFAGESLPSQDDLSGVIVLGGPQHIHEADRPRFLDEEISFLADIVRQGHPVLGICLGSQLLAEALGGRAIRGARGPEVGPIWVEFGHNITEPSLRDRSGMYFSMHEDSFELPPGAELLAWSREYPQAFRMNQAVGVQFHPEVSPDGIHASCVIGVDVYARAGADRQMTTEWARANVDVLRRRADGIFTSWLQAYVQCAHPKSATRL